MAVIRYFDNCFENDFIDVEYDFNKSLIEQIESHSNNQYTSEMIECYNPEEDKTFYIPLTDTEDMDAVIIVNGKNVDSKYEVKQNDIVNVVYLPMSSNTVEYIKDISGGAVAGAIIGGLYAGVGVALGVLTGGAGLVLFSMGVGFLGGALIGLGIAHASVQTTKNIDNEKGKQLPDVRGSSNASILNSPYAFTVGKHLVNPRIISDPCTEYSEDGLEAYVKAVYEIGYAPVKITDIKMGDFVLAPNGTNGTPNYVNGLLKSIISKDAETGEISGEIDGHWSNNDVEVEILQHNPNHEINFGHIYPNVKKQKEVAANVFFLNDDALGKGDSVVYKGKTFTERFRTNGVWFTESFPDSFSITLNAPNGLYSSYTDTTKNGNETINKTMFGKIPLYYAVQWRPYSKFNDTSKAEGEDFDDWKNITVWNGVDCSAEYTENEYKRDIEAHKGNDITQYPFDTTARTNQFIPYSQVVDKAVNSSPLLISTSCLHHSDNGIFFGADTKEFRIPSSDSNAPDTMYWGRLHNQLLVSPRDIVCESGSKHMWLDVNHLTLHGNLNDELVTITLDEEINVTMYNAIKVKDYAGQSVSEGTTQTFTVKYVTFRRKYFMPVPTVYNEGFGYYGSAGDIHKSLCNFERFTGKGDDDGEGHSYDYTGQVRLTAKVTLTDAEKQEMMKSDNTINGIEVRVIRVTPNYINLTSPDGNQSACSYSDSIIVDMITTELFDETVYKDKGIFEPVRFQSEDLVNKMCYIAVKAKADDLGVISQQIKEISCTVESFSPVWQDYKWLPENVKRIVNYYGYYKDVRATEKSDRNVDAYEVNLNQQYIKMGKSEAEAEQLAKKDYEKARNEGYSWYADEIGSNYSELIKKEVFPKDNSSHTTLNEYPADILPDSARKFNDATSASGFMLAAVGPQNGRYALGYEDVDLLSMAECYEAQQNVEDGSTYSVPDGQHIKGSKVSVRFEANGYVYQALKLEELLAKIAVAGRSVYTYDKNGRIKMIMDKPVDYPRGVINQQNCLSFTASYNYEQLPAGLRIQFPDENDGYEQNCLYCWSDGNTKENYKGNVDNYNFDFVTNNAQAWSLGRYVLANRVLNREAISAKIGMEGESWGLGDVIIFQDEDLLIGDGSGRVKEIIKDSTKIYGFIMDSVYTYTGETETEDSVTRCRKGVQIFTPQNYGNARVQDFRLATPDYHVTVGNDTYQMKVGETNLVLFENPITVSLSVEEIHEDDIVMFGDFSKISAPYRIIKIKPEKDSTFTCSLIQYTEELYNYGRALPSFQNYMTIPSPTADGSTLSEAPSTVKETIDNNTGIRNALYKGMLAGSEPYYAVTNTYVMPDLNVFNEAKTEEEYVPGVFCSSVDLVMAHYNETFRYFWSGVRYVFADGTKVNYISNVTISVWGEQGVAGTDYRFDLTPENVFLNPTSNGASKEPLIEVSSFLYKETVPQVIKSIECYYKIVAPENLLTSSTEEIKESDTYIGLRLTIPTNQFRRFITNFDTFPIIVVCHFDDGSVDKTRMATISVSANTSGLRYYFYLDYTNIKMNEAGEIYPQYIIATPLKMTANGVYTATEGEGGTKIKYRILPDGQYKEVGHQKIKSSDTFSESITYHAKFAPQVAYKNNADGSFEYGSCWTVKCSDGENRAIMFFNRINE